MMVEIGAAQSPFYVIPFQYLKSWGRQVRSLTSQLLFFMI